MDWRRVIVGAMLALMLAGATAAQQTDGRGNGQGQGQGQDGRGGEQGQGGENDPGEESGPGEEGPDDGAPEVEEPGEDGTVGDEGVVIAPLSKTTARRNAAEDPRRGPVTNLPMPRFVSLKGSEGNARRGPSLSHRVDWVFRHAGMPLRVTAEYGQWRRVEDRDGAGGWVHYSLLSGVRTAVVEADMAELRARPSETAPVRARAEAGAVLKLDRCEGGWCDVSGGGVSGWLPKAALWGVDELAPAP